MFRYYLTLRLQRGDVPVYWKIKSSDSSSCNWFITQFSNMSRYTLPLTVSSLKKMLHKHFLKMAQNTLTLGQSCTCSRVTCKFSAHPYTCVILVNLATYVRHVPLIAKNKPVIRHLPTSLAYLCNIHVELVCWNPFFVGPAVACITRQKVEFSTFAKPTNLSYSGRETTCRWTTWKSKQRQGEDRWFWFLLKFTDGWGQP